jgi:four helix bundle protein
MAVSSYKDLLVWQKAIDLVTDIYTATRSFPAEEKFGLTAQLRRAAVSVPSNIAEGSSRKTSRREFIRFLDIAFASLAEIETQLTIARNLGFLEEKEMQQLTRKSSEIMKMLYKFMESLKQKNKQEANIFTIGSTH